MIRFGFAAHEEGVQGWGENVPLKIRIARIMRAGVPRAALSLPWVYLLAGIVNSPAI